jgi:hypothetical protein
LLVAVDWQIKAEEFIIPDLEYPEESGKNFCTAPNKRCAALFDEQVTMLDHNIEDFFFMSTNRLIWEKMNFYHRYNLHRYSILWSKSTRKNIGARRRAYNVKGLVIIGRAS